jgi:hypothetical protein
MWDYSIRRTLKNYGCVGSLDLGRKRLTPLPEQLLETLL